MPILHTLEPKIYLGILGRNSNQISWLFFSILVVCATNIFLLYAWYQGGLKASYARENANLKIFAKFQDTTFKKPLKVNEEWTLLDTGKMEQGEHIILKKDVNASVTSYKGYMEKTKIATLPFINVPFYVTDFAVMYLIMGSLFVFWLGAMIKYTKNVLEDYFNEPVKYTEFDYEVPSMFFFILPTLTSRKAFFYCYIELILLIFIVSILLIISTDIYDICCHYDLHNTPLKDNPSFSEMIPHFCIKGLLLLFCLITSVLTLDSVHQNNRHIRNVLFLLRWGNLFMKMTEVIFSKKLVQGQNLLEYRIKEHNKEECLYITLQFEGETQSKKISASINFVKSINKFISKHEAVEPGFGDGDGSPDKQYKPIFDKMREDYRKDINRQLTYYETFIMHYFYRIMVDSQYEKELYGQIK